MTGSLPDGTYIDGTVQPPLFGDALPVTAPQWSHALSEPPDHAERLDRARRWSHWLLGDESWADALIEQYLADPAASEATLAAEMDA